MRGVWCLRLLDCEGECFEDQLFKTKASAKKYAKKIMSGWSKKDVEEGMELWKREVW